MIWCSKNLLHAALLASVGFWSGCCCCNLSALRNSGGGASTNTSSLSADEQKELETATEYAQMALNKKGYQEVLTAALRKDGLYWYVEGTAKGKQGETINYIVMFQVSQFDNRQSWSVQTVSVNGETVYP